MVEENPKIDIENSISNLHSYQKRLKQKIETLENDLRQINGKIETAGDSLKKEKYRLLSILIHEGPAGKKFVFIEYFPVLKFLLTT